MNSLRIPLIGVALLVSLGGYNVASATVSGTASFANCLGGGVTVTAGTIDWKPTGSVAGTGCMGTGLGTAVTYTAGGGGVIGPSAIADIRDLPGPNPFIYFLPSAGVPNAGGLAIQYLLGGLFQTAPPTNASACNTLLVGQSCVVFAGSPFLLTLAAGNQTTITLGAQGTVTDGVGPASTWSGAFTTQSVLTPLQIQQAILGPDNTPFTADDGSVTETHSSTLTAVIPEPATISFVFLGAGLIGIGMRRRSKA